MTYGIVGSREYPRLVWVERWMRENLIRGDVVVSGGARGVDKTADAVALDMGLVSVVCTPPWSRLGKSAGMIRNPVIVRIADEVVAFWDGTSVGTLNTILLAEKAGKLRVIIGPDGLAMSLAPGPR